ncbi:MAG: HEAT repeat domain-containing protein [Armatimonadota bacterium]|nr:HEAT repeat domain-containing protein [Armatimonadota bacterium]
MKRLSSVFGLIAFSVLLSCGVQRCESVVVSESKFGVIQSMTVSGLVAALRDPSYQRVIVCIELGTRNDKSAIASLRDVLIDSSLDVRVAAGDALLKLGDTTGVPALKDALASSSATQATLAAAALARNGDYAGVEIAKSHLADESTLIRVCSLTAVGLCPDDNVAYAALQAGLVDKSNNVQGMAIWLLSKRKSTRSVELLASHLSSPDCLRRRLVLQAIVDTQLCAAIPVLVDTLSDSDGGVRYFAAKLLNGLTGRKQPEMSLFRPENVQTAQTEWRAWWSVNKQNYPPGQKAKTPEPSPAMIPAIL